MYSRDPHWVAPLLLERKLHFSPKHNPFFQHAKAAFWLASRDGRPVGRISAQIDDLHILRYADATGHFGFIEAVDDASVFAALLAAAEGWLRDNGMTRAVGPVSFSMWDQPGLLVDGFDTPPSVMMGHALPYFEPHIRAAGYGSLKDLIAYDYPTHTPFPAHAKRIVAWAKRRGAVTIRNIRLDKKHAGAEIDLILDIMNDAWSDNWGFVPMTPAEAADLGSIFRQLLKPQDVAIASHNGQEAAFALILPNLNEAIRDLGGRLAPLGWAKLLWRMKIRGTQSARMPLMGVRKSLQTSPIGAALALSVIEATRSFHAAHGAAKSELSWILDQNHKVKHIIEMVGARAYKKYRIYEKLLANAGARAVPEDRERQIEGVAQPTAYGVDQSAQLGERRLADAASASRPANPAYFDISRRTRCQW